MSAKEEDTTAAATAAKPPEPVEQLTARVLKIHETPKCLFDWINVGLPVSKLYKQAYSPHVNFQDETDLWIVAFLGRGGNGEVWFAITPDRERCCAVKFFSKQPDCRWTSHQLAQRECDNWSLVYGNDTNLPKCHVGHLCSNQDTTAYLCMPYISALPRRLWPIMADATTMFGRSPHDLEAALGKFVQVGFKQGSMRWSHIGFFPVANEPGDDDEEDSAMAVYIMDLGRLENFEDNNEKNIWVQQSIEALRSAVPASCIGPVDFGKLRLEGHFREHVHTMIPDGL